MRPYSGKYTATLKTPLRYRRLYALTDPFAPSISITRHRGPHVEWMREREGFVPSYDEAQAIAGDTSAQRLLNLLFYLQRLYASALYGRDRLGLRSGLWSPQRDSDLRKFRRDRAKLAEQGIQIVEAKPLGAAESEESYWKLDRKNTFATGGIVTRDDAQTLAAAIDEYLEGQATPLGRPLRSVRDKALELAEGNTPQTRDEQAANAFDPISMHFGAPSPRTRRSRSRTATRAAKHQSAALPYMESSAMRAAPTLPASTTQAKASAPFVPTASKRPGVQRAPTTSPTRFPLRTTSFSPSISARVNRCRRSSRYPPPCLGQRCSHAPMDAEK